VGHVCGSPLVPSLLCIRWRGASARTFTPLTSSPTRSTTPTPHQQHQQHQQLHKMRSAQEVMDLIRKHRGGPAEPLPDIPDRVMSPDDLPRASLEALARLARARENSDKLDRLSDKVEVYLKKQGEKDPVVELCEEQAARIKELEKENQALRAELAEMRRSKLIVALMCAG
jgi:hypothetical protein